MSPSFHVSNFIHSATTTVHILQRNTIDLVVLVGSPVTELLQVKVLHIYRSRGQRVRRQKLCPAQHSVKLWTLRVHKDQDPHEV